ncbi:hypothetical protein THAOC_23001, partial [Thalassiosira oceanica]
SIRALVDKKNKDDNERLIKARNAGSGGLDGMDDDDDVQAVDDYKSVLQSADDDGAELNEYQKWHIALKAIYLREAYKLKL